MICVWMHPTRPQIRGLSTEGSSKDDLWWCFGWLMETSARMARMVFSGFFDRWQNMKIITHHLGAMVPSGSARGPARSARHARGSGPAYAEIVANEKEGPPRGLFKNVLRRTAINGSSSGNAWHRLFAAACC